MCGIIGYIGKSNPINAVLNGLLQLEYRGYDSAGLATVKDQDRQFSIYKCVGRVSKLKELVDTNIKAQLAIGHTRWATHGKVNVVNAHPLISASKKYAIVHNGIITNYKTLKIELSNHNYTFQSETDSEVIVNLFDYYAQSNDAIDALRKTVINLEGSYAFLIIDCTNPSIIYFAKNKSPLLLGKSESSIMLASDTSPLLSDCNKYFSLTDGSYGECRIMKTTIYDLFGDEQNLSWKDLNFSLDEGTKGEFPHYMLKEIYDQPSVIRNLISCYFSSEKIQINDDLVAKIRQCDKINFVACGTSMYASYIAKYYFEKLCSIPSEVFVASELVYSTPLITTAPFFIFLSQSGETADSISVMKKFKKLGYPILAITNSEYCTMNSLADYVLNIHAGKEIAVASTKAYIAQVVTCAILAKSVSNKITNLKNNLNAVALAIENILTKKEIIEDMAAQIYQSQNAYYIGRGIDYWVSLESSLKLKEISYICCEAYSSGELKHGPIALISEGTPVIAICTQEGTNSIVRNNLEEVKCRGAKCYVIAMESLSHADDDFILPNVAHYLSPLVSVVVTQLLAYYCALKRNNDVDKPRNLAKSVTVE